jgi:hypothetical protein
VLKWIAAVVKLGDKVNLDRGVAPAVGDVVIFHPPAGATDGQCGAARVVPPRGSQCRLGVDMRPKSDTNRVGVEF